VRADTAPKMPPLRVQLEATSPKDAPPGEFAVRATFSNASGETARLNVHQAAHPSLVLEVRDEHDQPVLLPPPSVPDEREREPPAEIQPGASLTIDYAGFLDRSLPAGTYRVRYAGRSAGVGGTPDDPLESPWLEFVVGATEFAPGQPLTAREARALPPVAKVAWYSRIWIWLRDFWHWLVCLIKRIFRRTRCDRVLTMEVDEARTETISNAPAGSEAWNGTYGWHARFHVTVDEANCRVTVTLRVRISGAITAAQQTAWENAIESAWSNSFKLCCRCCCCRDGYTIVVDLQFVASGEHQVVNVGASTTNMGNWSASDTVDVRHEFGHMLGNLEEYFTINGVDYNGARRPDGNIMNNPANDPVAHHYDLVRDAAAQLLGTSCATRAVGQSC
jgi:hypothetical protein